MEHGESESSRGRKAMIEESISISCFIDNGANTAVLGEYLYGEGKNLKSVVYVHCGI